MHYYMAVPMTESYNWKPAIDSNLPLRTRIQIKPSLTDGCPASAWKTSSREKKCHYQTALRILFLVIFNQNLPSGKILFNVLNSPTTETAHKLLYDTLSGTWRVLLYIDTMQQGCHANPLKALFGNEMAMHANTCGVSWDCLLMQPPDPRKRCSCFNELLPGYSKVVLWKKLHSPYSRVPGWPSHCCLVNEQYNLFQ